MEPKPTKIAIRRQSLPPSNALRIFFRMNILMSNIKLTLNAGEADSGSVVDVQVVRFLVLLY